MHHILLGADHSSWATLPDPAKKFEEIVRIIATRTFMNSQEFMRCYGNPSDSIIDAISRDFEQGLVYDIKDIGMILIVPKTMVGMSTISKHLGNVRMEGDRENYCILVSGPVLRETQLFLSDVLGER